MTAEKKTAEETFNEISRKGGSVWDAMEAYAAQKVAEATKDFYPKGFMEWIGKEELFFETTSEGYEIAFRVKDNTQFTFDELFDYWTKNIK